MYTENDTRTYNLPTPSEEQSKILNAIKTNNIIVDAVAGSGKTTCILHIAIDNPNDKILLLTYNSRLKSETRNKIERLGLTNIDAHSYNSYGYTFFNKKCSTDTGMYIVVDNSENNGFKSTKSQDFIGEKISMMNTYNIIILDECQDMTGLFYEFVHVILRINAVKLRDSKQREVRMCLLGDAYQSIYAYNGADIRYMKHGDIVFLRGPSSEWIRLSLSVSYRLTNHMIDLVNHLLKYERIKTVKKSEKRVVYYKMDMYGKVDILIDKIQNAIREYGVDQIFILAPSVKQGKTIRILKDGNRRYYKSAYTPVKHIINKMTERGINIYLPSSDDSTPDDELLKNKLALLSFHQSKGLERKCVIVLSMEDDYYMYYNRNDNKEECSNIIYVALTRASEELIVIHNQKSDKLRYIDDPTALRMCEYREGGDIEDDTKFDDKKNRIKNIDRNGKYIQKSYVSSLLNHMTHDNIKQLITFLDCSTIRKTYDQITISSTTVQNNLIEYVADLTGEAIPAYYEYMLTGKLYGKEKKAGVNGKILINDTLQNYYYRERLEHRSRQIMNRNWLTNTILNKTADRLSQKLTKLAKFEVPVQQNIEYTAYIQHADEIKEEIYTNCIIGRIDCMDIWIKNGIRKPVLWEFKCTNELKDIHFIQVAIYGCLYYSKYIYGYEKTDINTNEEIYLPDYKITRDTVLSMYVYNILSNELVRVNATYDSLERMVKLLLSMKSKLPQIDSEFIERTTKCVLKYNKIMGLIQ